MGNKQAGSPVSSFGTPGHTAAGFGEVIFADSYGVKCGLTCSTIIGQYADSFDRPGTSAVWLGVERVKARVLAREAASVGVQTTKTTGWVDYPIPPNVLLAGHMHLNREQVQGLVERLQQWLDHGNFDSPTASPAG